MNAADPRSPSAGAAPLAQRHCKPCEKGTLALTPREASLLVVSVPGWKMEDKEGILRLERTVTLQDFRAAIAFVDELAELAEAEGHHPDFMIRYNRVTVSSWTHVASGLTENDFILAAKIDELAPGTSSSSRT